MKAAGVALVALTVLTQRYGWVPVLGTIAGLAVGALFVWRLLDGWRERRMLAPGERTVLYQHWFRADLVAPYVAAGWPAETFGYSGISNAYRLRCAQHAESSWWYSLIDPARSTCQTWPNRRAALRAEARAIATYRGVGNQVGNPDWVAQSELRRELQALALRIKYEEAVA
jgi:hypothetical protein